MTPARFHLSGLCSLSLRLSLTSTAISSVSVHEHRCLIGLYLQPRSLLFYLYSSQISLLPVSNTSPNFIISKIELLSPSKPLPPKNKTETGLVLFQGLHSSDWHCSPAVQKRDPSLLPMFHRPSSQPLEGPLSSCLWVWLAFLHSYHTLVLTYQQILAPKGQAGHAPQGLARFSSCA